MDLLQNLNPSQQEAVKKNSGPLMVLAGAGSGKTRTLVAKMAYLLSHERVGPQQILSLTFSNKAAKEMRERLFRYYNLPLGPVTVSTFHAFCAQVLRTEGHYLGIGTNFTIYDRSESKAIVKTLLENREWDLKKSPPAFFLSYIDELKNQGFYLGREQKNYQFSAIRMFQPDFEDDSYPIFQDYERELVKANAVDFGGLLTAVLQLFEQHPEILKKYQQKFQYILVDEYQDTNRAQFELVAMLAAKHKNICVVGDEDQSIYSWRGADIRNILEFDLIFPEGEMIKLEQNYRSTKKIIEAASTVIAYNKQRKGKALWTDNEEGTPLKIYEFLSDRDEALQISEKIKKLILNGVSGEDIAILYRTNAQSRLLEEQLRRLSVPFRILGGIEFYERKEIKDVLAYLRLIVNPKDSLALSRVINVPPRGVGTISIRKLEQESLEQKRSLWESVVHLVENPDLYSHWRLNQKVRSSLLEFKQFIEAQIQAVQEKMAPSKIYRQVLEQSGLVNFLKASKDYESLGRLENLEEFYSAIVQYEQLEAYPHLAHFLETITLDQQNQSNVEDDDQEMKRQVSLMTVHSAKGLEFPYVFIVGVEENLFPSYLGVKEGLHGIEEERRLFYVAMTRAMKELTLSFAQARMQYGEICYNGPGQFLREIPEQYFEWISQVQQTMNMGGHRLTPSLAKKENLLYRPPTDNKKFTLGSRVRHELYGDGTIRKSEGSGEDEKVVILFSSGIQKMFKVKYAPIVKI